MKLSVTAIILAFVTSVLGAPVPTQQLDRRSPALETREPVHWMNIQLHRLDEEPVEPTLDSQDIMNIMKHRAEVEEEEEETEPKQPEFDAHLFRIGIVY